MSDDRSLGAPRPLGPVGGTDEDWELIDRYVAGECLPDDAARVERRLAERPDLAEMVAALRNVVDADASGAPVDWDADAASARLARTIRGDAGASHRVPPPLRVATSTPRLDVGRSLGSVRGRWLKAAAAIALIAGGGAVGWRLTHIPPTIVASAPPRVYQTPRGQRGDIRLPDGTHVMLAAESRLTVPASFDRARREVTLEGEAYFEATHDAAKPFTVLAGAAVVRDLGTRFDVRAYPERRAVEVVVVEGKVDLQSAAARASGQGTPALLARGQWGRLDTTGVATVRSGVDVERFTGWVEGRLAFDGTPLRDVAAELGRWYDLDVTFADSGLGARRVTVLLRQQSVPSILDALALVTHTRYERLGRQVRFVGDETVGDETVAGEAHP